MNDLTPVQPPARVWWSIWAGLLGGVFVLFFGLKPAAATPVATLGDLLTQLAGVVPLFLSIVIRWLVLPRFDQTARAFPVFVAGCALAEGCAILGMFLGGPYRGHLFVLGVLGLGQFIPVFLGQLQVPKPRGFTPNN